MRLRSWRQSVPGWSSQRCDGSCRNRGAFSRARQVFAAWVGFFCSQAIRWEKILKNMEEIGGPPVLPAIKRGIHGYSTCWAPSNTLLWCPTFLIFTPAKVGLSQTVRSTQIKTFLKWTSRVLTVRRTEHIVARLSKPITVGNFAHRR